MRAGYKSTFAMLLICSGCGSSSSPPSSNGSTDAATPPTGTGTGKPGTGTPDASSPPGSSPDSGTGTRDAGSPPGTGQDAGRTDAGGTTGSPDAGGGTSADAGKPTTDAGSGGGGSDAGGVADAAPPAGSTVLTGTLGTLGPVKPTVSSLWISNSGETLIYLSSAALTCDQLKVSRWLGSATAASQVVEVVIKGAPTLTDYPVPPGEVNYAEGGKSSSYEVAAQSGKITFTRADAQIVEGSVTATYASGNVAGTFSAQFCDAGQGY